MYDLPLIVARGYASLSFLYSAAQYINTLDVPTFIYHCGDFDPSGVNAGEKIEETLHELAPDADITFERIAVTPEQITAWALPTRPTKPSDTRSKNFGEISVELDAIEPNQLRALVQEAIELHLPVEQFEKLKAAEESERDIVTRLVGKVHAKEAAIASLARMKAEAELASLYRERSIARAWAARRDPKKRAAGYGGSFFRLRFSVQHRFWVAPAARARWIARSRCKVMSSCSALVAPAREPPTPSELPAEPPDQSAPLQHGRRAH